MRVELPVCKRCCFCLPLRYGLLAWGYIRVVISILALIASSICLHYTLSRYRPYTTSVVILSLLIILILIDIIFSIAFVIGCHKKMIKLLKPYRIYSICLLTFTSGITILQAISYMNWLNQHNYFYIFVQYYLTDISVMFLHIAVQIYMVLLIRSEIIKLRSGNGFSFVNNAAEAECAVEINQLDVTKDNANSYTEIYA